MKYDAAPVVSAIYGRDETGGQLLNPYLEAMPELLSKKDFFARLKSLPAMPFELASMSAEKRRQCLPTLMSLFYPMDYMYVIYDMLFRAITSTYNTKSTIESIRQINAVHQDFRTGEAFTRTFSMSAESGSILGVPGIGKTSTVRRCLGLLPQVIIHTEYKGKPFYNKQITHLIVECPSDCSIKTLAYNIAHAIDKAIGSEYFERMSKLKNNSASAIATQIKIICLNHHVGVIVIDEIQNAVTTAEKNKQIKPLIRFLVELTNDACASICFVGTPMAEELFVSQEHLKRRTRGVRLLPIKPGAVYRDFLGVLWSYQYTARRAELTDKLANKIYDYSAGIPAYIVKIFQEAQAQAMLSGSEIINAESIQAAVDYLAIQVPKTFKKGSYISDFTVASTSVQPIHEMVDYSEADKEDPQPAPRLYAHPRGRKKVQRDATDLLEFLKCAKSAESMVSAIEKFGMSEVKL